MIQRKPGRVLIGILCVLALIAAVVIAVILDSRSPEPILGILWPEQTTQETTLPDTAEPDEDTVKPPLEDLPASVDIPTKKDPQTGENEGLALPYKIPQYGLVIEKMAPYDGMFVEDGSNAQGKDIAMIMVHNDSETPLEYTRISVHYGQQELLFDISALPAGEKLVVQEKTAKAFPEGQATGATALLVQRADMELSEGKVGIEDNGDNTLTIHNLTDKTIPTVRVFYKYYLKEEGLFVGGIAFTLRVTRLGAGASMTVHPAHYTSHSSRVVMVLTYEV